MNINQTIIYFEYGGRMTCHYNPSQDGINIEDFLKKLKIFRDGDDIRVDWQNRFIMMDYAGGEQVIKVFTEEREWDNQGSSTRKSYQLVKSLEVPRYQSKVYQGPVQVQPTPEGISPQPTSSTEKTPTPSTSKPTTSKPKPGKAINHIDELKKKQAEGKLKPSEIKKARKKKTLKQWLEDSKISEEKYEFLSEWLNPDEVFSLAEINAKYWELKDKE